MTRRAYRGFWAVLLLVLAVGIFGRGRRNPEPKPTPAQPSSRVTGLRVPEPVKPPVVTSQLPIRPVRPKVTPAVEKPAPKSQLRLRVVGVYDGDTLTGLDDAKTQHKIRLDAIDAPELGQPYGQAAKRALSSKVFGKNVVVTVKSQDKYGRTVGHVLIDGRDVNLDMLEEGMAWHYVKYDQNRRLGQAEQQARASRVGLWADPDAIPPWEWRKLDKNERARRRAVSGMQ